MALKRSNEQDPPPLDALVVGAGPAGLAAAMYLARFRRRVRVVHDGRSRALWVPRSHNVPGFPEGVVGSELIERMTEHAQRYGSEIVAGRVAEVAKAAAGASFLARLEDGTGVVARGLVLATGVDTNLAQLDVGNHEVAVRDGVLRYCPICDGYEHGGDRIAVLGSDLHGAAEAMFLRQYSNDVTLIPKWQLALTGAQRTELAASGVEILEGRVVHFETDATGALLEMEGDVAPRRFDVVYPAFGSRPRSDLAAMLDPTGRPGDCLRPSAVADGLMPGVYAAGDVVEGLDQISVAVGHGAMVATRLHNWLRKQEGHVMDQ